MADRPAKRPRGYRPIKGQGSIQAGIFWAERVTAMSVGLVAPVVIGWAVDWKFDTQPWGIVIGALVGFALLMTRLMQMITPDTAPPASPSSPAETTDDT